MTRLKMLMTKRACLSACVAAVLATACGDIGATGNVNPALGETSMTRCVEISGHELSYEDMTAALSDFGSRNAMKFLDDRPSGAFASYLQIDDPYVIVDHRYFAQRETPTHLIVTFRSVQDDRGYPLEAALYEGLAQRASLQDCAGYTATVTPGWRLNE